MQKHTHTYIYIYIYIYIYRKKETNTLTEGENLLISLTVFQTIMFNISKFK